jgi:membrane glycosyltransferase
VLLGLVLAVPLALLSGRPGLGLAAARRGWFLVPEEIQPPPELAWMAAAAHGCPGGEVRGLAGDRLSCLLGATTSRPH